MVIVPPADTLTVVVVILSRKAMSLSLLLLLKYRQNRSGVVSAGIYRTLRPADAPVSIFDGWRGSLLVLPPAIVDFRIYRIQLGVPDRGGRIDRVDYVVLPIFPLRRGAHANDWGRSRRCLHISLHHFAPAGLRTAHGAIALFIVLAIVMYVTRKVDWYARDAGSVSLEG